MLAWNECVLAWNECMLAWNERMLERKEHGFAQTHVYPLSCVLSTKWASTTEWIGLLVN